MVTSGQPKQLVWTREELVLACALLFENDRKPLRASDARVKELSDYLRSLPTYPTTDRPENFRSPSSVQHKLYDLWTRFPEYGKALTKGGKQDQEIVDAFFANEPAMMAEAARIRSTHGRAWSLISKDSDHKYTGNAGYPDVLGAQYVYDSHVPNSRKIGVGDLIVVRDNADVLGVACVESITAQADVPKAVRLCPECHRAGFEPRKTRSPRYLCRRCRHEFDEPLERTNTVTQFAATYGATWRALDGSISLGTLNAMLQDQAQQNAIRPLDRQKLVTELEYKSVQPPEPPTNRSRPLSTPVGGHRLIPTKVRRGQDQFRKQLLDKYGQVCAITGPCPAEALEAAHLRLYAQHATHDLDQGILLRADIHSLLDREMLAIDPDTWTVMIRPSLSQYEMYRKLEGAPVRSVPDVAAVRDHFLSVTEAWR